MANTNNIKEKVRSLYEMMKEENIQELEINFKDYNVCIKRKNNDENEQLSLKKQQSAIKSTIASSEDSQKESAILGTTIKSPLTGIFYRSPSPSTSVYANEGDTVEIGNTVCIIEAMKVMNEIKATFKAKILKILIENGSPVNSEQDLFEVEKV
ncbi:MAG: hypothetical protein LBS81_02525 [Endomicrobium sp.]|jgi:acetyl-CoA carboxylase biotin carboxyl carrier protein|nr:hypothetical protein [Endomicrobium sp.]